MINTNADFQRKLFLRQLQAAITIVGGSDVPDEKVLAMTVEQLLNVTLDNFITFDINIKFPENAFSGKGELTVYGR